MTAATVRARTAHRTLVRRLAAELPLLVVAALLLGSAADLLPPDSLVGVGEVQLNLARLLILAGLAAVLLAEGPRPRLVRTWIAVPLLLLVAASLLSSLAWDAWPRFRFVVESVALFYLTLAVVRSRAGAAGALMLVALVALAVATLPGIAQVAQDQATGFYRQGWVPVNLGPAADPPEGALTRAIGTFANPNVLAGYVLLLAPLAALALGLLGATVSHRLALGLAVGLGYLALVLTFSRAAVAMALLAPVAWFLVGRARERRVAVAVLGLGALAVVLAVAASLALTGSETGPAADFGRKREWTETLAVIREYPRSGVGLGRLGFVLQARDVGQTVRHAHNLFLTWGAEAGLGALVAWVWIFAALLWRSGRSALQGVVVARGAFVAVVGFLGFSMLDHPANVDRVATAFWIVAGLAAAGGRDHGEHGED